MITTRAGKGGRGSKQSRTSSSSSSSRASRQRRQGNQWLRSPRPQQRPRQPTLERRSQQPSSWTCLRIAQRRWRGTTLNVSQRGRCARACAFAAHTVAPRTLTPFAPPTCTHAHAPTHHKTWTTPQMCSCTHVSYTAGGAGAGRWALCRPRLLLLLVAALVAAAAAAAVRSRALVLCVFGWRWGSAAASSSLSLAPPHPNPRRARRCAQGVPRWRRRLRGRGWPCSTT